MDNQIVVFKDGALELDVKITPEQDTVWLSLEQLADLFEKNKSTISRHNKNIFTEGELFSNSVVANFATTASDGKTYNVSYYSLDVIISVGYRVKSKRGIAFRKWASKIGMVRYTEMGSRLSAKARWQQSHY